jgi:hypothetical protein
MRAWAWKNAPRREFPGNSIGAQVMARGDLRAGRLGVRMLVKLWMSTLYSLVKREFLVSYLLADD